MGADIHIIAEVKENGVWKRNIDKIFKNPWYDPERWKENVEGWERRLNEGDITKEMFDRWVNNDSLQQKVEFVADPSDGRNYDWFAILADVRNGHGFAGVSTGAGFDVIAIPKGLPDDISVDAMKYFCDQITDDESKDDDEIEIENEDGSYTYFVSRERANEWMKKGYSTIHHLDGEDYVTNPDYHSSSYLYVDEFDNFDWNQVTMLYGVVSLEQYKKLRGTNEIPKEWSGAISGQNIVTISEDEADKILDGENIPLTRDNRSMFRPDAKLETKLASEWDIEVDYKWSVLYSEWFEDKIKGTIEPLRALKEKYGDARIVFVFDN